MSAAGIRLECRACGAWLITPLSDDVWRWIDQHRDHALQVGAIESARAWRTRPTAETLPLVADYYREALASGDRHVSRAPTSYVARRLACSRGHAARLVTEARKAGLLGPAQRGQAGEVAR